MTETTPAGLAELLAEVEARIMSRLDAIQRQLDAARNTEADDARFLAAVAAHCLKDGKSPTFNGRETYDADDEAVQRELWWVGDGPAGVTALFNRCEGHRIGNVRLTRVGKKAAGIAWRWELVRT